MKNSVFLLLALLSLGFAGTSYAEQKKSPCGSWPLANDMKCVDKGGTVTCSNGASSPMCCKTVGTSKTCTNNPDTLPNQAKGPGQLTPKPGGTAAPGGHVKVFDGNTGAAAKDDHKNHIEIQSYSLGATQQKGKVEIGSLKAGSSENAKDPKPNAPGDVKSPGKQEPAGLLVPAVQKAREAAK